jgi:epoxyqueuosine reductase
MNQIPNPKSPIPNCTTGDLTTALKSCARSLGFTLSGVCPAVTPTGVSRLADWLDRGYAGQMHYIAARQEAYSHPRHVLDGCRSILMLGLPYSSNPKSQIPNSKYPPPGSGGISNYACGPDDYHDTIHDKLKQLIATLHDLAPHATARGVVDTAPLLEREFAQLAGIGWIGKHTLLIQKPIGWHARQGRDDSAPPDCFPKPQIPNLKSASRALPPSPTHSAGSYFFLAALLTDLELTSDDPFTADHCGTCRACLDACPTQAFPQPYVLDATRCISYLTIELRDHIPHDLRPGIGDWLFGCDICQEVCPWNHHDVGRALPTDMANGDAFTDSNPKSQIPNSKLSSPIELISLFNLDDATFRTRFRHTPLWRPRRRGILRNAAIVLGNQRAVAAVPALIRGLNDSEPLIRAASAWALGQIGTEEAHCALRERHTVENDATVVSEIGAALTSIASLSTRY